MNQVLFNSSTLEMNAEGRRYRIFQNIGICPVNLDMYLQRNKVYNQGRMSGSSSVEGVQKVELVFDIREM